MLVSEGRHLNFHDFFQDWLAVFHCVTSCPATVFSSKHGRHLADGCSPAMATEDCLLLIPDCLVARSCVLTPARMTEDVASTQGRGTQPLVQDG